MLKPLQLGKATGPDAINNRVLKELAQPLSFPLSDLFNFPLTSGKVLLIWKEANVTPIFKKMILQLLLTTDLYLYSVQ